MVNVTCEFQFVTLKESEIKIQKISSEGKICITHESPTDVMTSRGLCEKAEENGTTTTAAVASQVGRDH